MPGVCGNVRLIQKSNGDCAMESKEPLDEIGIILLEALQQDARLSYADLGRRVGLSPPAVTERIRRLEISGVITGYRAQVNRSKLGYSLTAFIRLRAASDQYDRIDALVGDTPEILECHHVTGEDGLILKVIARSVAHLDQVILNLAPYAATTSSIVLSTQLEGKPVAVRPI